ncbi:hypothetical protein, partial [Lacticaseibacillus rhamnosus]|uniref:hypothetical protein n=4 Tax=Lacticaseibacillus rhamnosus TaxID=47715 RepID=UPI001CDD479E
RRLEPARPAVSKSPNNISDKARSLCCSTAEPHLAYDCSALALESLKSIYTYARNLKNRTISRFNREIVRFYFEAVNYGSASSFHDI